MWGHGSPRSQPSCCCCCWLQPVAASLGVSLQSSTCRGVAVSSPPFSSLCSMRCLARSTSTPTSPRSICPSWTPATWTPPAASASCSGARSTPRPSPASTAPMTPSSSRYPGDTGTWGDVPLAAGPRPLACTFPWATAEGRGVGSAGEGRGGRGGVGGQLLISPPQLISAPINLCTGSKWS